LLLLLLLLLPPMLLVAVAAAAIEHPSCLHVYVCMHAGVHAEPEETRLRPAASLSLKHHMQTWFT